MARTILEFEYNRNRGVKMTPLEVSFLTDDKNGHEFHVSIVDNHGDVDLSGCTAEGKFIADDQGREDDITIDLTGRVDGNVAILPLNEDCYKLTGRFTLTIKVKQGEDTLATVFWGTGNVLRSGSRRVSVPETVMYLPITGTAANSAKLGGKPPEAYSAVNLLDNSNFRNPVNQRGRSGVNLSAGEMIDRWKTWADGATVYFNQGLYMGLENQNLLQYIPEPYDRGVLTAAVKIYGEDKPYVCTLDTSVVGSASDRHVWLTREAHALSICVVAGAVYEWAAVYEGAYTAETLPPYVPKPYVVELAECQRYFIPLCTTANKLVGNGFINNAGAIAVVSIPTPVTMRDTPSLVGTPKFRGISNGTAYDLTYVRSYLDANAVSLSFSISAPAYTEISVYSDMEFALSADLW